MTAEPDVFFFPYAHDAGSSGPGSVPPPDGGFLILASDGLWDNISSGRAAALIAGLIESKTDFMQVNPATALIREAFSGGAYSRGDARGLKRADDLLSIPLGAARNYRDDVTVVVCFLTSPNTLWTAEYAADVDGARIDDGVTTVDADGMGGDKPERITEWMSQNSS